METSEEQDAAIIGKEQNTTKERNDWSVRRVQDRGKTLRDDA